MFRIFLSKVEDGKYTRIRLPVKLVYKEIHSNRSQAQRREAQIKSWTKKKKLALLEGDLRLLKEL